MCDKRKFIETICCKDGDCLIFAIDMNTYDIVELKNVIEDLQNKMPEIKIVIVPSGFINNIIHVSKDNPISLNFDYDEGFKY